MDFSFGFGLGSSAYLLSGYNPLINYDWSITTTSGLRYLRDVGSTPTYNASMYFGRGAYFNGVDQYVSINTISLTGDYTISFISNTDGLNHRIVFGTNVGISNFIRFQATSITYRVNSIEYSFPFLGSVNNIAYYVFKRVGTLTTLYINGVSIVSKTIPTSTIIFDKVGTSAGIQYFNGTLKDVYMFNRALNQSEITQSYEQPELFYAMAQADSTCVLNMPMCETDGYARNMKSYSEVQKEYSDFNNGTTQGFTSLYDATVSILNNQLKVTKINSNPYIGKSYNSVIGNYYKLKVTCNNKSVAGNIQIICSSNTVLGTSDLYMTQINTIGVESTYEFIVKATTTTTFFKIRGSTFTSAGDHFLIDNWEVTDLGTSIYPILNYTSSVRDNAKNLQYGLQTCKFVRDSLGVIQSASNYLECNGTGHAIIPSHTNKVNIKMTVNPTSLSGNLLSGGVTKTLTGLTLNVDNDVVINDITPTGAITLASGFSGTIKTYTEELV